MKTTNKKLNPFLAVATGISAIVGGYHFAGPGSTSDTPDSKIEVTAGETYGWIGVISVTTNKLIAINLHHIRTFRPTARRGHTEIFVMGSSSVITTKNSYDEVWKKVGQASRK